MKKTIIMLVVLFGMFSHADAATLKASTLRVGSTGETVKAVQQKLSDLGYEISVDGKFGRKTSEAVAKFQASKNLKADGLCGEKTLSIILGSKKGDETVSLIAKPNSTTPVFDPTLPIDNPNLDWLILCRDGKPHMRVISPNGGEIYQDGQQITVKWKSCNMPVNNQTGAALKMYDTNNTYLGNIGLTPNVVATSSGSASVTLPALAYIHTFPVYQNALFGLHFKVVTSSYDSVSGVNNDDSDNLFTINGSTDMCRNIDGMQTMVPAGYFAADGNCYKSTDSWEATCSDKKAHIQVLSPNGGEVYQAGQQVEVKWRSCNFGTSNVYVQIIGWNPDWFSAEGYPNRANTGSAVITIPNNVVVNGQSQIPLGGYNVPEGKKFSVEVGKQYAVSGPSIMDRSDSLFTINAPQPKVQVGTSATNPPTSTVTASQTQITSGVRLLGFTVKAIDGNVTLKKVPVQINSTGSSIQNIVSQLKLVDASGNYLQTTDTIGNYISSGAISASTGCTVKDCGYFFANFGNIVIPSGTTKEFSIIADIRPITTSTGDATRTLKVSLANNDIVSSSNLGVVDQNGNTITANSTYRIGSAGGNVITISTAQVDMCPNISGIQTTIPAGMTKDVSGNCVVVSSVSRPTSTWENLCADGQPHAQIISPNGNEWYRAGQQMEVRWKTCNHPAGATVETGYTWSDSANGPGGYQNDTAINDGIETHELQVNAYNGEWRLSGKYYKAFVGFSSTNRDYSDDFFTIWDGNIIKPSPRTNSVN